MKLLSSIQRTLSYGPLSWIVLFLLFVLRAYFKLGRIPFYGNPDPKDLGFEIHHGFLFFTYFFLLLSLLFWLVLTGILFFKERKSVNMVDVVFYLVFYLVLFLFGYIDPWGLQTWFMD